MAIWDFRPRGDIVTGVAVGVAALAAPVVIPLAWAAVRPWLRALLKGGVLLYETGRGAYAEVAEGSEGRRPQKVTQIKVKAAPPPAREADREGRVPLMKSNTEELIGTGKSEKPAAKKPRRPATRGKKKLEKKV